MRDPTATISVNGGKKVPMEKDGALNPEAVDEIAKIIAPKDHNKKVGGIAVDQLKSVIGRVEKLEEEKARLSSDIKDVYAEAKKVKNSATTKPDAKKVKEWLDLQYENKWTHNKLANHLGKGFDTVKRYVDKYHHGELK